MNRGARIPFSDAFRLAQEASKELRPTLARLKAVGSLRRKVMNVRDIEFLAEPHYDEDLLGERSPIIEPVKAKLLKLGTWVKGGERMMVITDLFGHVGMKLELFLVHPPSQWGSLLAIRTGPSDLSRYCVTAMRKRGYRHDQGHAKRLDNGEIVPTPTEDAFFELAGVTCLPPGRRDEQAIQLTTKWRI